MTLKQSFKFFLTFTLFSIFISCSNNENELRDEVKEFLEKSYPAILKNKNLLLKLKRLLILKLMILKILKNLFPNISNESIPIFLDGKGSMIDLRKV